MIIKKQETRLYFQKQFDFFTYSTSFTQSPNNLLIIEDYSDNIGFSKSTTKNINNIGEGGKTKSYYLDYDRISLPIKFSFSGPLLVNNLSFLIVAAGDYFNINGNDLFSLIIDTMDYNYDYQYIPYFYNNNRPFHNLILDLANGDFVIYQNCVLNKVKFIFKKNDYPRFEAEFYVSNFQVISRPRNSFTYNYFQFIENPDIIDYSNNTFIEYDEFVIEYDRKLLPETNKEGIILNYNYNVNFNIEIKVMPLNIYKYIIDRYANNNYLDLYIMSDNFTFGYFDRYEYYFTDTYFKVLSYPYVFEDGFLRQNINLSLIRMNNMNPIAFHNYNSNLQNMSQYL